MTRQARPGMVGTVWRPALDLVWEYLRENPGLRTDGHNVFLYRHAPSPDALMEVEFGVEVTRGFAPSGEVHEVDTPAGEAAIAMHVGGYERLGETHAAVRGWVSANRRELAGYSMEVYGDWSDDPRALETTVIYLLR